MRITDELREWASYNRHYDFIESSGGGHCELLAIADRIDAEHRKALEKVAAMADGCPLEARVERIEKLLNHKGA